MDSLLRALGHEFRLGLVRELHRSPGPKHGELLSTLGLAKGEAGNLTKHLAALEEAGVVRRDDGRYYLVDPKPLGRAMLALAELHVSATRLLAERASMRVPDAERLADELRDELDAPDNQT